MEKAMARMRRFQSCRMLTRWDVIFLLIGLVCLPEFSWGQSPHPGPVGRVSLNADWQMKSSVLVPEQGDRISQPDYSAKDWYPTRLPATALSTLIRNRVYPDMRIGLNSFRIPDASDEFNQKYDLTQYSYLPDRRNPWKDPYWFRTMLTLPESVRGKRVWLNLKGINYRADVWLNGLRIADAKQVEGAFSRHCVDATAAARPGPNALAVQVYPVDHPGVPDAQLEVFGPDRKYHKEIMKDVALVMSIGYDCMPTVPDRHLGFWQGVEVQWTGPVDIRHPFVRSELPLPATSPARLTVSVELLNASDLPQEGILSGRIEQTGGEFATRITLQPGQTQQVVFRPEEHPGLIIANPRLWWPNGYGDQMLYDLRLEFHLPEALSDQEHLRFGIRQVSRELYKRGDSHGLRIYINGQRIFCRGGYLQPEILFDWDASRMEAEIRYLAEAHLNLVFFEDIPTPPDEFLDACDKYGIMFGNCFYGCYWMTPGTNHPENLDLLARSTVDIIQRIRNHPSLVLYMAMNEGDTRREVYTLWRDAIQRWDGTRLWIPSGSFPDYRKDVPEWIQPDLPTGVNDYPPKSYGWVEPEQYFRWVREKGNWMFMLESGSASLPPMDSLRRFIPDLEEAKPESPHYPLTPTWAHHGANHYYKPYDEALRRTFGPPKTVLEYCRRGQLLSYDQHRAMFEAAQHRMWEITSGFSQWKLNACWPTIQWHIYDWYLRPMVSFYAIRKACEPIHVQMTPLDRMVTVVNNRFQPLQGLRVQARLFDMDSKLRWHHQATLDIEPNSFREVFPVPALEDSSPVYFVRLDLADAHGMALAQNFYWLPQHDLKDLAQLEQLPLVPIQAQVQFHQQATETVAEVLVENLSDRIAFFIHLAITRGPYGEEILPVWWDDNYCSLLPGEKRRLRARFSSAPWDGQSPVLEVGGWNVLSRFDCDSIQVSAPPIRVGAPFTVTAQIRNTVLGGSPVQLLVNDRLVATQWVWARTQAGRQQKISFPLTLSAPGPHTLRIANQTLTIQVE